MTIQRDVPEYRKISYLALLSAFAFPALAAAQSIAPDEIQVQAFPYIPPSSVTSRTQARLVEVPVMVRDGKQRAVAGLTRNDFEIYDSGKKQAVTTFSVQKFTPPPAPPGRRANRRSAS
jgi:hypothetical protein